MAARAPALLIYNPTSGTARGKRLALVQDVAAILRRHGYELRLEATTHRASAAEQVRNAIADGAQVVFACGGDGTIHDCLQAVVGTSAALAPVPMGSANALCRELGIPMDSLRAAAAYRSHVKREVRIGRCESSLGSRCFLLMAGAGPDGALMYRMLTVARGWLGRWSYAAHALRLLLRGRFRAFRVRYREADGAWHEVEAVSAMALRIGSLGGVFPGVARGASLNAGSMRLVLVKRPALLALPLWFLSSWLRIERWNPLLVRRDVTAFTCDGAGVHAQADGEWIGRLPLSVSLTEETVQLLVPATS